MNEMCLLTFPSLNDPVLREGDFVVVVVEMNESEVIEWMVL